MTIFFIVLGIVLFILFMLVLRYSYVEDPFSKPVEGDTVPTDNTTPMPENELYLEAKSSLHKHMTLDSSVAAEVGCAEAISAILALIGVSDGPQGIPGTAALDAWLHGDSRFEKISLPEAGAIVVSPTGQGNGSIEGHTGIFGEFGVAFPEDWGIMSNDSASGFFLETWNLRSWNAYYVAQGGLPLNIYRFLG